MAVLFGLVMWLGVQWCVPVAAAQHGHGFDSGAAACSMGALEHLGWWESQLTAAPAGWTAALGLLVAAAVVAAATVWRWTFAVNRQLALIQRLYTRHHPAAAVYRPLGLAFADGLLHPKVPPRPRPA